MCLNQISLMVHHTYPQWVLTIPHHWHFDKLCTSYSNHCWLEICLKEFEGMKQIKQQLHNFFILLFIYFERLWLNCIEIKNCRV